MKTALLCLAFGTFSAASALAAEPFTAFQHSAAEIGEVARSSLVADKFPVTVTVQAVSNLGRNRYRVFASNGCHVDARAVSFNEPHPDDADRDVLVVKLTQVGPLTCE